jgi:hypothetical protein
VVAVLDVHARGVKIKKFFDPDVITMHLLQKRFMKRYLCLYAHGKPCVPHNTMVENDD